jgi:exonuclease SbcC
MHSINKISFTNFKLFGPEKFTVSFQIGGLTLMDGPNGYGKTSIFDAIELALTGTIKRFISTDGRQTPADIVVAFDSSADVVVDIILSDDGGSNRAIRRRLKSPLPSGATKISKFHEIWDAYVWDGKTWVMSTSEGVCDLLKNTTLARDFHLFHYIQQEETAGFLKSNSETERASKISELFGDTKEAEKKLEQLRASEKKITALKNKHLLNAATLKKSYSVESTLEVNRVSEESHFYLLPWLYEVGRSPEWDGQAFADLNQVKYNSFMEELSCISAFIMHRNEYSTSRRYLRASNETDLLLAYVRFHRSFDYFEALSKTQVDDVLLREALRVLSLADLQKIGSIRSLDRVSELVGYGGYTSFNLVYNKLMEFERAHKGLQGFYVQAIKYHDSLSDTLASIPAEDNCLFCGHHYPDHDGLLGAVSVHGEVLRGLLNSQEKAVVDFRDDFKTNYLEPLKVAIGIYLENNRSPSKEEVEGLRSALGVRERVDKLHEWLGRQNIQADDIVVKILPSDKSLEECVGYANMLAQRIRERAPVLSESYQEANYNKVFDRVFRDYFSSSNGNVVNFDLGGVVSKQAYITSSYYTSLRDVISAIADHELKASQLKLIASKILLVIEKVRSQIRTYQKTLICEIEIPFYLYSGKILQSHQSGLGQGVFLKDPTGGEELKNVRLVSNWNSDHDVLNTMSSGQISAVVISLTLALNKIYSRNFSPILIDDPVQTMDDINMSSLVELMRNEFGDKQIILSTHEDKVSKYLVYKYLKYSKAVRKINLMAREESMAVDSYKY